MRLSNKMNKFETHDGQGVLAKRLHPSVLLTGDSVVAELSRYPTIWKAYVRPYKTLNCGIPRDRVQHLL